MRYEDWDVLLFPRDCKVPLREFKVDCHVVQDLEFSHTHGSAGLPTVCCFVPSLPAGTPFQVSLHSWTGFPHSHAAQAYSSFADSMKYEARLYIDGRLVSSSILDRNTTWPSVFAHSYALTKNGDLESLGFPTFRHELLKQDYWSPADNLGRIKIIISEGFSRDSLTNPIERVQNIVAFSFQHAPLDVLEGSSIAWPSQPMWQRAPFAVSHHESFRPSRTSGLRAQSPLRWRGDHVSNTSGVAVNNIPGHCRLDMGILDSNHASGAPWEPPSARLSTTTFQIDDDYSEIAGKVPTNTPTASANPSCDSEAVALGLLPRSSLLPSALAHSLTKSILSQPPPLQIQSTDSVPQPQTVRSRKENSSEMQHSPAVPPALSPMTGTIIDSQPVRKVSQTLSHVSTASVVSGSTGGASLEDGFALSRINSPLDSSTQHRLQTRLCLDLEKDTDLAGDAVPPHALAVSSGNTVSKGTKRGRNFTPGSIKAVDDENEPRRVSPRTDATAFRSCVGEGSAAD